MILINPSTYQLSMNLFFHKCVPLNFTWSRVYFSVYSFSVLLEVRHNRKITGEYSRTLIQTPEPKHQNSQNTERTNRMKIIARTTTIVALFVSLANAKTPECTWDTHFTGGVPWPPPEGKVNICHVTLANKWNLIEVSKICSGNIVNTPTTTQDVTPIHCETNMQTNCEING